MVQRLTREEFRRWPEGQTQRYERIAGEPVAMSPKRAQHVRLKSRVWAALDRSIRDVDLDCEALADGMTVEVGADTDYEPDALVNCGPRVGPHATAATNPPGTILDARPTDPSPCPLPKIMLPSLGERK